MSDYSPYNWRNNIDATNQTRMNAIEQGIANTPGMYFVAPYTLINNTTINDGVTQTVTCTGVGGVPSGAKGAVLHGIWYPYTAAMRFMIAPHGSLASNYPQQIATITFPNYQSFFMIIPLDGGGQIDVKPTGGNIVIYLYMIGYTH